jgi:hypothetical protein
MGDILKPSNNKWKIQNNLTEEEKDIISNQWYIFVTMSDGQIRVKLDKNETGSVHAVLSGSTSVRYAGKIMFDENNEIIAWNNDSKDYCSSVDSIDQAGLDVSKFQNSISLRSGKF